VRMLRAARFEAKLNFRLDAASAAPVAELRHLMAGVPAARLFDETLKLFLLGHGLRGFDILMEYELLDVLLPTVASYLRRHPGSAVEALVRRGLANTDERVHQDKSVTPSFLFAVLLYGPIAEIIEAMPPQHWHEPGAILDAVDTAVRGLLPRIAIPRRFSLGIRDMFAMQPRLEQPRGRRALRLLENPRFRAAYDLMKLRAEFGLADPETSAWWTKLQEVSPEERGRMADAMGGGPRGPGGGGSGGGSGASGGSGGSAAGAGGEARPRRRGPRRRRRARGPGDGAPPA
jgi:poly(A) polymerase